MSAEVVGALAELRNEIGVDKRLREVETTLAGVLATLAASSRPSQWPAVMSACVGVGGVLVAFAALLAH